MLTEKKVNILTSREKEDSKSLGERSQEVKGMGNEEQTR